MSLTYEFKLECTQPRGSDFTCICKYTLCFLKSYLLEDRQFSESLKTLSLRHGLAKSKVQTLKEEKWTCKRHCV